MVFSSLRSRNRHSANPNPRLHTNSNREAQVHRNSETHIHGAKQARKDTHNTDIRTCGEKKVCITRWQQENDTRTLRNGCDTISPPPSPHPLLTTSETLQHITPNNSTHRSSLHPQAAPPAPLLPAHRDSSLASAPSFVPLVVPVKEKTKHYLCPLSHTVNCKHQSMSCEYGATDIFTSPVISQQQRSDLGDPMPKKKSRKSSMPVKIERERPEKKGSKELQGEC